MWIVLLYNFQTFEKPILNVNRTSSQVSLDIREKGPHSLYFLNLSIRLANLFCSSCSNNEVPHCNKQDQVSRLYLNFLLNAKRPVCITRKPRQLRKKKACAHRNNGLVDSMPFTGFVKGGKRREECPKSSADIAGYAK